MVTREADLPGTTMIGTLKMSAFSIVLSVRGAGVSASSMFSTVMRGRWSHRFTATQSRRAAEPQGHRAAELQGRRAGEPHSCMAAGPQSCRAAGPQSCRAGEPGSRRAGDQTMSRSHEAPYTLQGCTLRLTRLHFLTNVDKKIYAGFMNIVMIYLTALRHLFQRRSDISENSAAEMSQCSATFTIIVRGAELAKVPNSCT